MRQVIVGALVAGVCMLITTCGSAGTEKEATTDTSDKVRKTEQESQVDTDEMYTRKTKIADVRNDEIFGSYGRMIFPVESGYYSGDTLEDLKLAWYNNIDPDTTVEIVNYMKSSVMQGETIFYDIYSDEEKADDPEKENTGLFFFRGNIGEKFAVCNAGGAFAYVGAMQDSFPHALELSKKATMHLPLSIVRVHRQPVKIYHGHSHLFSNMRRNLA